MREEHLEPAIVEGGGKKRECVPVRTPIITAGDDILEILEEHVKPHLRETDVVVISSKVVAISQEDLYYKSEIKVSFLAWFLSRFVTDSPYGVGIRNPKTMQVAINTVGVFRILLAAAVAAVTKLFGFSGYFYRVAGLEIEMIDGIADHHFEELHDYVILPPREPNKIAEQICQNLGVPVAIADVNDLGGSVVVGMSGKADLEKEDIEELLRYDNPLGQTRQQTPVGIIRPMAETEATTVR